MKEEQEKNSTTRQSGGGTAGKPSIACGSEYVVVCEQYITRPHYISPKQWMEFWERIIARDL